MGVHCETCLCRPQLGANEDEKAMQIIRAVAQEYVVSQDSLSGRSQQKHIVEPRHEAMLRLRKADFLLKEIGHYLQRDHSTVIAGIYAAEARRTGSNPLKGRRERLERKRKAKA